MEYLDSQLVLFQHVFTIPYFLGKPIDSMLEALPAATLQMEEVKQTSQVWFDWISTNIASKLCIILTQEISI